MSASLPLVGVVCNFRDLDGHHCQIAGQKYVEAVLWAGCQAVLLPALGRALDADCLLERLDGVMLTGGVSNVEPHHYGGGPSREGTPHDPGRDALALALVRGAVARGQPVLGICRGLQEMNVAFGGSLHQHLHEVPGRMDHRSDKRKPLLERYQPRHPIATAAGGQLRELIGATEARVNSLHGQGVDRLGAGLAVEAVAEDGTVEALRVVAAPGFALGVQWHAEFEPETTPVHFRILSAFGGAARGYAGGRRPGATMVDFARG
ncbi:MAG: gamma-glutamyl-gamma-aminobutyrate hydrolase family protein [Alphaproteobacteria bacterium]|nr:gamma-glutamyl-gamma-aminobutyrate hydrolase family protein [Alphaproteobacteria bacterium]